MDRHAFVFTGISLLLAIPAVILAASLVNMMQTGDVATTVAIKSDTVYYPYHSVELNFRKTLCNYIYIHRVLNTVNTTGVQQDILNTWVPAIENNFSASAGVNIDINETAINITFDSARKTVIVGGGTNNNETGIGINITDQEGRVVFVSTLGPYSLPIYCGNPTSTSSTCEDTILLVNITAPGDGETVDTCTNVSITATGRTDDCGLQLTGDDATFSAFVDFENTNVPMTDDGTNGDAAAGDGIYTGQWQPAGPETVPSITVTATHTLNGWGGTDSVSNIVVNSCNNSRPSSRITNPGNGTSFPSCSPITISGTATDTDGTVQYVEVSTDGGSSWHFATGTTSWTYTWTPTADGTYNIRSRATDDQNATEVTVTNDNSIYVTVTGCNLPPTVNITAPPDGTTYTSCPSSITVEGTSSDSDGWIDHVEVSTDAGATWNNATGTTLWSYTFSPSGNGDYDIVAKAYDNDGATNQTGITVYVSGCGGNCSFTWNSSPDVGEEWKMENNGPWQLKKSTDPSSPKYDAGWGTDCSYPDGVGDMKCEEKFKDGATKHTRLEFTWYNATMDLPPNATICGLNLTMKYNLEKNKRKGSPGWDVKLNLTNLQTNRSTLTDIDDTPDGDKRNPANWNDLNIYWTPAAKFTTNDDLTIRLQAYPESTTFPHNKDEIKLNIPECLDNIVLYITYGYGT